MASRYVNRSGAASKHRWCDTLITMKKPPYLFAAVGALVVAFAAPGAAHLRPREQGIAAEFTQAVLPRRMSALPLPDPTPHRFVPGYRGTAPQAQGEKFDATLENIEK